MTERRWYTVTACRSCGSDTALIVEDDPKRYACVSCTETGNVKAGGFANVPDQRPDSALRARLSMILDAPSMKDFVTLCKAHRGRRDRLGAVSSGRQR